MNPLMERKQVHFCDDSRACSCLSMRTEIVVLPPLCNPHHYNPPQLSLSGHPTALLLTEPNAPVCSPALRNPRARVTHLHSYNLEVSVAPNQQPTWTQHLSVPSSSNHNTCLDCEGLSTCCCSLKSPSHHHQDNAKHARPHKVRCPTKICTTT